MEKAVGEQASWQGDDHASTISDDTVQFTDMDSDAGHHDQIERIVAQPPVTINVYGAGGISGPNSSEAMISRLESQVAALSDKVEQLTAQLNSAPQVAALSEKVEQLASQLSSVPPPPPPQPSMQIDGGQWTTRSIPLKTGQARGLTQQRILFSKKFASAPMVLVSIYNADVDCHKNFRVSVFAKRIDAKGFTVNINTWADTVLYDCGVSWIAVGTGV